MKSTVCLRILILSTKRLKIITYLKNEAKNMNDVFNSLEFKYMTLVKRIKSVHHISMSNSYNHQVQHNNKLKQKIIYMESFIFTLGLGSLALNLHGDGRNLSRINVHGGPVESPPSSSLESSSL